MPNQTKRYIVLETVASAEKQHMIKLRCMNRDRQLLKTKGDTNPGILGSISACAGRLSPCSATL
ncbi:MAG: hypothetical protein GDA48_25545 [Hormoscilla sp. GM102CHS1]|nr:hypothetical protein [Hormoscilla sp. GM102CHS1]